MLLRSRATWWIAAVLLCPSLLAAGTLEVGPGKRFARIEDAHRAAKPGDVILVHPLPDGRAYEKFGLYVAKARLTFRGAIGKDGQRVKLSGKGFDHSGRGSTPRAMFQFNRGTDYCVVEGFDLSGAHNSSHNGAGIRVNQANHVTIRNCEIHHNDMGMMSNGDGSLTSAVNQVIEHCIFHHNGDRGHPGYNHNLYLGGTSVTMRFCELYEPLTGHNYKSRAHFDRIEYSYIHHSANREFDLVDAKETGYPGSHAVLIGNVIVKHPKCPGNKAVIHFGQDGRKAHDGTLHLVHNTIVTPYISPVVDLSTPKAAAVLTGNLITDTGRTVRGQTLGTGGRGGVAKRITGTNNWIAPGFAGKFGATGLDPRANVISKTSGRLFVAPEKHDYRLGGFIRAIVNAGLPPAKLALPQTPGVVESAPKTPLAWQYKHPAEKEERPADGKPDLGAYEYTKP